MAYAIALIKFTMVISAAYPTPAIGQITQLLSHALKRKLIAI